MSKLIENEEVRIVAQISPRSLGMCGHLLLI